MYNSFGLFLVALVACLNWIGVARADNPETAQLREELRAARSAFETRIADLEARLEQLEGGESRGSRPDVVTDRVALIDQRLDRVALDVTRQLSAARSSATAFNPQISVILGGSYVHSSEDPEDYSLQGFIPGGEETGPPARSFNLGESELTLSGNIDPLFYGEITAAVEGEGEIAVEEAFIRSIALRGGISAQFGRFFSALGYINGFHAHAWDFVDTPLVYEAMLGGQYATDGLRLAWLAPLDNYLELGVELGSGRGFPGAEHSSNHLEAALVYASFGADLGDSASWKATLAYLANDVDSRTYEAADRLDAELSNPTSFSGDSELWSLAGVYKWAPQGNSRERYIKLQGEYFLREEDGHLGQHNAREGSGLFDFDSSQSGWYLQGVYQFRPAWRVGLRYDRLDSGDTDLHPLAGTLLPGDLPSLASHEPERASLMLDYSPTEFSRLRLQFARDESAPDSSDNRIMLQYVMSLGAHGAHRY